MSLFNKSKLTFVRYGEEAEDKYGRPVASERGRVRTTGSLQAMSAGEKTKVLPEGRRTNSAYIYYSKTKLNTADVNTGTPADTTMIDGRQYEVFDYGDWTKVSSMLRHNQYILVSTES